MLIVNLVEEHMLVLAPHCDKLSKIGITLPDSRDMIMQLQQLSILGDVVSSP